MKESSLKTTKKRRYSRTKYSKISNYYDKIDSENEYVYRVKIFPNERFRIKAYFSQNNIEYINDKDWLYIYLKSEEDVKEFFNNVRGEIVKPLYVLLRGLLYREKDLENNIRNITILSSTERFIQKYNTRKHKGLFKTVLLLFKMISVYRLHCYCTYKLTKNDLVIKLMHSKYDKNVYQE